MNRLAVFFATLLRTLRRLLVLAFGALLLLCTLVFGALLALALLLWAKLRGRPVIKVARFGRGRKAGEVVDVEAREVPETAPPALERPPGERRP
jgi:hypothetical protein